MPCHKHGGAAIFTASHAGRKFDTDWQGVTIDDLLASAGIEPPSPHTLFHGYEGYSTNLLLSDITDGKAMIATRFDDQPLTREHGGPRPVAGAPSLFLEIGKVGEGHAIHAEGRKRLLGTARISPTRRSMG